jgi:hypothetical protein
MWCAIARKTFTGRTIDPQQRISREQALAMYTRHAAHAGFWESSRGMLQPGLLADIAVLDRNLDEVADEDFEQVRVDRTIVDARIVYSSSTAPG